MPEDRLRRPPAVPQKPVPLKPVPTQMASIVLRRLGLLSGAIPLSQMTQAEVDWVFRQAIRTGGG